jgi:hypothetical protein
MTELEELVTEWYSSHKIIDRMKSDHNRYRAGRAPADRMIAAHDALMQYVEKQLIRDGHGTS